MVMKEKLQQIKEEALRWAQYPRPDRRDQTGCRKTLRSCQKGFFTLQERCPAPEEFRRDNRPIHKKIPAWNSSNLRRASLMILFLAPPVLVYLTVPSDSFIHTLSYLLPSAATFYGLMDLLDGQTQELKTDIIVLSAHCILWLLVFSAIGNILRFCHR